MKMFLESFSLACLLFFLELLGKFVYTNSRALIFVSLTSITKAEVARNRIRIWYLREKIHTRVVDL